MKASIHLHVNLPKTCIGRDVLPVEVTASEFCFLPVDVYRADASMQAA